MTRETHTAAHETSGPLAPAAFCDPATGRIFLNARRHSALPAVIDADSTAIPLWFTRVNPDRPAGEAEQGLGATDSPNAATGTSGTVSGAVSESVSVHAVTLTEQDKADLACANTGHAVVVCDCNDEYSEDEDRFCEDALNTFAAVETLLARHVAPLAEQVDTLTRKVETLTHTDRNQTCAAHEEIARKHAALVARLTALADLRNLLTEGGDA
jgi:hypothetical protein